MELTSNIIITTLVKIAALIAAILLVCRNIVCYDANIGGMFVFAIYIIVYVELQGLGILKLFKIELSHVSGFLLTGFFTGFAALVVEYFLCELVNTDIPLYIAGPLFAIIYFINLKRYKIKAVKLTEIPAAVFVLVVVLLFFALIDSQLDFVRTNIESATNVYQDYLYHMTLIDSIAKGYPIVNPDVSGMVINYHFFSDLLLALPVRMFGLSSQMIIWDCAPYVNTVMFATSVYGLFRCLLKNNRHAGLFSLFFIASLTQIHPFGVSDCFKHIVTNINAFSTGIGALFCIIVVMCSYLDQPEIKLRGVFLLTVLAALLMGIKAPLGLVFIASMWGALAFNAVFIKNHFRHIITAAFITVGSAFVYFACVGAENGSGAELGLYLIDNIKACDYWEPLQVAFNQAGIPDFVQKSIIAVLYVIVTTGILAIPFFISFIRELILVILKKREIKISYLIMCAMSVVAVIVHEIVKFPDFYSSEGYFLMIYNVIASVIALMLLDEALMCKGLKARVITVITSGCLVMGLVGITVAALDFSGNGIYNHKTSNIYDIVTNKEYEGLCWIRNNTPEDALFATDRYMRVSRDIYDYRIMHHNTFFGYTAYSGRNFYLAGSGYTFRVSRVGESLDYIRNNELLYEPTNTGRAKKAKQLGIDYVIVSRRFNDSPSLNGDGYERCFNNSDITVYKIK